MPSPPTDPDKPEPPPGEWPKPPNRGSSRRQRTRDILDKYKEPSHRFPWRIAIYSAAVAYLFFDLYVLNGPLRKRINATRLDSETITLRADEEGWVALVNGRSITDNQLRRAVEIYHYKRGIDPAEFSPENRRLARLAALEELIEDKLVSSHVRNSPPALDSAELDAAVERFTSQFPTPAKLRHNLRAQHLAPSHLRKLIETQVLQVAWIEENIAGGIAIDEEELRAWHEANRDSLAVPEIVRARHIFLSTVEEDSPERETLIRDIHLELFTGEADFASLALEHSEDHRSKVVGGDLNYFGRHRMPADFADIAFAAETNTVPEPFRTALGWHILEVTGRKPARDATFEEMRPEILSHLESRKREIAVAELISRLKENSVIKLFPRAFEIPEGSDTR